jgi:hypothetical protein
MATSHSSSLLKLASSQSQDGHTITSPLLDRPEAARFLRISVRSLDSFTASKELRCVRLAGRVLYRIDDLFAFIEAKSDSPTPEAK